MKFFESMLDKLYVKQWTIGLAYFNAANIENKGIEGVDFFWIPESNNRRFYADPFVFKNPDGKIHVIYEDYTYGSYGKVSMHVLDENFNIILQKRMLDTGSHLSYPNVFHVNNMVRIMPESGKANNLLSYEYDFRENQLVNPKKIMENEPLLDSTILEHNGRYWLFATKRGPDSNNKLYIYHSEKWDGDYVPHKKNPVKDNLNGSRPAGNFIKIGNNIYRPAQNSKEYYGKSISMNRILVLNEDEFVEEHIYEICSPQNTKFKFAIHTINLADNVIVVDGLRRIFNPGRQIITMLYNLLKIKPLE